MNEKESNDIKEKIKQYIAGANIEKLQKKCNFNFDLASYFAHKDSNASSGSYVYVRVSCEELKFSCLVTTPMYVDVKSAEELKNYFGENRNCLEASALKLVAEGRCIFDRK